MKRRDFLKALLATAVALQLPDIESEWTARGAEFLDGELLPSEYDDISALIHTRLMENFRKAEERYLLSGDGSPPPEGFMTVQEMLR